MFQETRNLEYRIQEILEFLFEERARLRFSEYQDLVAINIELKWGFENGLDSLVDNHLVNSYAPSCLPPQLSAHHCPICYD